MVQEIRQEGTLIYACCQKTKKGLALKRWFKEDWKDVCTGKKCGRRKGESELLTVVLQSVFLPKPQTTKEMTAAEKRSRVAQKKRLGQPAGKPRRVKSLKEKETMMRRMKSKGMKKGGMVKSKGYRKGERLSPKGYKKGGAVKVKQ